MVTASRAPRASRSRTAAPDPAPASAPAAPRRQGLQLLALALGFVMAVLDTTIMNVAGPSLRGGLHLSLSGLTWVISGYILVFASLLLLAGSLAGRYGARRTYLAGLALFTAASLLCAAAPTAGVLLAGRLLQGAGAALFMPSSLTLLLAAFPGTRERARVLGLWSAIVSTAAGLGPALGGVLVDASGWRSIFLINLPFGIAGLVLARRVVADLPGRPAALGVGGHALGLLALAGLSYGLIQGPERGWTDDGVLGALALAVLGGAAFALRERRAEERILPAALLANSRFRAASLVGFLFNFAAYGTPFVLGLFFQQARGASPMEAGLELLPTQIVWPLGNILYTRYGRRLGDRAALAGSLVVAAAGMLVLALTVSPGTPYWVLAVVLGVLNTAVGVASPAMTGALMDAAGAEHAPIAGAALNANRQIGSLVGVAVMSAVVAGGGGWYTAVAVVLAVAAAAYGGGALAAGLGLRARRERARTAFG
ncbi:DHA2 family efflux MFS transporter permease subunit [Streptomyces sp. AV19]|uniref:DHA2 family efflux MFS transporter permease subunit n=1 Tax=Streptomyces sp. AV19 TaxID=2793068 RepID=UPI0018FE80A8|nr:DHA2 family efflux MFS transporter permease subunit [Streptomyces sp. AV19]MBH1933877.1 DHA2 family efflux MFS transporter permease subunit [Streptomyces sp. AV19]MDG4535635.1 DHA2 family efflux MFS transporter permease subunit [Streptomyces sp. AV19]